MLEKATFFPLLSAAKEDGNRRFDFLLKNKKMKKKLCMSENMCNFAEPFSEGIFELRAINQEVKHKKNIVSWVSMLTKKSKDAR